MTILNDFGPFGLPMSVPTLMKPTTVTTPVVLSKVGSALTKVPAGGTLVPIGASPQTPLPSQNVTLAPPPPPSSTSMLGTTIRLAPPSFVAPPSMLPPAPLVLPPKSSTTTITAPPPPPTLMTSPPGWIPVSAPPLAPPAPPAPPVMISVPVKQITLQPPTPPSSTDTSTAPPAVPPPMTPGPVPIGLTPPMAPPANNPPTQIIPQGGDGSSVISPFPPTTNTLPGTTTVVAPSVPGSYQLPATTTVADQDASTGGAKSLLTTQLLSGNSIDLSNATPLSAMTTTQKRNLAIAAVGGVGAGYFGYKFQGPVVGVVAAVAVFFGVRKVMSMTAPVAAPAPVGRYY